MKRKNWFAGFIALLLLMQMFQGILAAEEARPEPQSTETPITEERQAAQEPGIMPLDIIFGQEVWGVFTKDTSVLYAPYAGDGLSTGYTFGPGQGAFVIGREYDYYYVYWVIGEKYMRGYVPMDTMSVASYVWIEYDIYKPAGCTATVPVLSGPGTTNTYFQTGSIYANENPLLLLGQLTNQFNNVVYYYVQYMAEGKVKRGWIDSRAGAVTARSLSFPSTLKINQKYYIYNLATRKVLQRMTNNEVLQQNMSNSVEQQFCISYTDTAGYVKIAAAADPDMVLNVKTRLFTEGLPLEMEARSSPTKSQEFNINQIGYEAQTGKRYYSILTRCTGNYRGVEVYGGASASGTKIIQSKYLGNSNQLWIFIPVQEEAAGIVNSSLYMFRNASTQKYLSVYNGINTPLTQVKTADQVTGENEYWRLQQRPDGTYQIISYTGSANRQLDERNNLGVLLSVSSQPYDDFTLLRMPSGHSQAGLYRIMKNGLYLSVDSSGAAIFQRSLSDACYWSISAEWKRNADVFVVKDDQVNFTSAGSSMAATLRKSGYTANYAMNSTAANALEKLSADDVFIFLGHGLRHAATNQYMGIAVIQGGKSDKTSQYLIARRAVYSLEGAPYAYIEDLSDNALSRARCVLYVGCGTGVYFNGYSLLEDTYRKGAHFVMGTAEVVQESNAEIFAKTFCEEANKGSSLNDCFNVARRNAEENGTTFNAIYVGDGTQSIN